MTNQELLEKVYQLGKTLKEIRNVLNMSVDQYQDLYVELEKNIRDENRKEPPALLTDTRGG